MVLAVPPLGLQVGDLRVIGWLVGCLWGCRLATYGSYDSCWAAFRAVMVVARPAIGL